MKKQQEHRWETRRVVGNNTDLIQVEADKINGGEDLYLSNASPGDKSRVETISRHKGLATALLKRAYMGTYTIPLDNLENQYSLGIDQYPTDLSSALTMLDCYVPPSTTTLERTSRTRMPTEDCDPLEMPLHMWET